MLTIGKSFGPVKFSTLAQQQRTSFVSFFIAQTACELNFFPQSKPPSLNKSGHQIIRYSAQKGEKKKCFEIAIVSSFLPYVHVLVHVYLAVVISLQIVLQFSTIWSSLPPPSFEFSFLYFYYYYLFQFILDFFSSRSV